MGCQRSGRVFIPPSFILDRSMRGAWLSSCLFALSGVATPALGSRCLPVKALDYAGKLLQSNLNYRDGGVWGLGGFGHVCQHASISTGCRVAWAVLWARGALLMCGCCGITLSEPSWPGMVVLTKPSQAFCPSVGCSCSLRALEQSVTPLHPQTIEPSWPGLTVLTKFGLT